MTQPLQEMQRVLGYKVTQAMLSAWLGVNPSILSQCLRIVRRLTTGFIRENGVEHTTLKNQSRRSLFGVAKIEDKKTRAAHLLKLATGSWPAWFTPHRRETDPSPYTRRNYGLRATYSVREKSEITDGELDELIATIRSDVEVARTATWPQAAA